jgi:GMP synthase (glutamine-hydrolysing)
MQTVWVVDCGSNKVSKLAQCIDALGAQASIVAPEQLRSMRDQQPDAIVISGNPALIADTGTAFLEDFRVLHESDVPVLGICFGHQVLGLLYDAQVTMGPEDRDLRHIDIVQVHDLFDALPETCLFQEDHTEVVSLPPQFTLLASSANCDNEAMAHKNRAVFGVQFHPESSGAPGMRLLANFLSLAAVAK